MRRPNVNLFRDGYEQVAERIASVARRTKGRTFAIVRPTGGVYADQDSKTRGDAGPELFRVGPYNRDVLVEWIEDDLIQAMKDSQPKEQAA